MKKRHKYVNLGFGADAVWSECYDLVDGESSWDSALWEYETCKGLGACLGRGHRHCPTFSTGYLIEGQV